MIRTILYSIFEALMLASILALVFFSLIIVFSPVTPIG